MANTCGRCAASIGVRSAVNQKRRKPMSDLFFSEDVERRLLKLTKAQLLEVLWESVIYDPYKSENSRVLESIAIVKEAGNE
jgi:hypothetical protein